MALKDIKGQQKAKRLLIGMLKRKRLPHALLFTGEAGVGKLFTAKNLIKTINCLNREPDAIDCCDTCRVCKLIENFNFSDLLFIQPEGAQIKIDTAREITEFLSMSPYEAKIKSVIINEAERLNQNAANALLKTLEEPPLDSLIVLISEKPDLLPDTIRSRCVRIHFSPLPITETGTGLSTISPSPYLDLSEYQRALEILKKSIYENGGEGLNPDNGKEELMKFIETGLILLRNRLVEKISAGSGRLEEIQVIIENYKRMSDLKNLMQFNLNLKITWNYIRSLLLLMAN